MQMHKKKKNNCNNKCIGAHLCNLRCSRKICWPIRTRVKQPRTCHCTIHPLTKVNSVGAAYISLCCSILWHLLIFTIAAKRKVIKKNQKTQTKRKYIKNTALWNESVLLPTVFLCSSVIHSHSCSTSFLSLRWTTLPHVSCSIWDLFKKQQQKKGDTKMECFP